MDYNTLKMLQTLLTASILLLQVASGQNDTSDETNSTKVVYQSTRSPMGKSNLSASAMAGICIGVVVGAIVGAALIYVCIAFTVTACQSGSSISGRVREYRPGSSRQIDAMQARYARNGLARPYPASAMIIDHYQPGPATPGLQP